MSGERKLSFIINDYVTEASRWPHQLLITKEYYVNKWNNFRLKVLWTRIPIKKG